MGSLAQAGDPFGIKRPRPGERGFRVALFALARALVRLSLYLGQELSYVFFNDIFSPERRFRAGLFPNCFSGFEKLFRRSGAWAQM